MRMGCQQSSTASGKTAGADENKAGDDGDKAKLLEEHKKKASSLNVVTKVAELTPSHIDLAWEIVSSQMAKSKAAAAAPVIRRSTWKTVRIFVSSTFKDFDSEREILVKKVFPDLRIWCQSRRLHLVECDLRWGIPLDSSVEGPLRSCLGEIDRCYSENVMPFFVNMVGERIGWIPIGEQLPDWIKDEYHWVDGLSLTEMEIMHAAYRNGNPNAIFLIRDKSFLDTVPPEYAGFYLDENPIASYKVEILKKMLERRFKSSPQHLVRYKCKYGGADPLTNWPRLTGLDETFAKSVFKFFQDRISAQYPLMEPGTKLDPMEETRLQHETFMKLQCEQVVGRDALIDEWLRKYVVNVNKASPKPVLIGGGPGLGKSSIMCMLANTCLVKAANRLLPVPNRSKNWRVFYHFVGAVSGSTNLLAMLNRLLLEIGALGKEAKLPTDLEEAMGMVRGALAKPTTNDCIIVIDAINQFDDVRGQVAPIAWLPVSLSPNVRLFLSAIPESAQYQRIQRDLGSNWEFISLQPLDRNTKEFVVSSQLQRYNKVLAGDQMDSLMKKGSSDNPMWLTLAAEELRIFGHFRQLNQKIESLPDGLFELEEEILARFERETEAAYLVTTLCLLECSVGGLLESELVELLASPNLIPKQLTELVLARNQVNLVSPTEATNKRDSGAKRITASCWADVYRVLRRFLRPFGSSGEGRLDFYHRSLSKVIRRRYFQSDVQLDQSQPVGEIERFFHRRLADYFGNANNADLERRVQEYPSAAYHCADLDGLKAFLGNWDVFDAMYDSEFSSQLSQGWALVHNLDQRAKPADQQSQNIYGPMESTYMTAVEKLCLDPKSGSVKTGVEGVALPERLERIARVLMQNRCCEAAAKVADRLVKMTDSEDNAYSNDKLLYHAGHVHLKAIIVDEDLRVHDYWLRTHLPNYDPKQVLPRLIEIVDCFQSAISIFRQLAPNDLRLGRCLNGVAFHYAGIAMRGGIGDLTADSAKRMAISHIEEAIALYSRLKDQEINVADCLITRGVCEVTTTEQQLDFYAKGQSAIVERFGPFHTLLLRVYFNTGIYHQENGNIDEAYTQFHKWYQLLLDVFGAHHPRTLRAGRFLTEGALQPIAEKRGHVIITNDAAPIIAGKKTTDVDGTTQPIGVIDINLAHNPESAKK